MEIVIANKEVVSIDDLKAGECFMFEDELYMKVQQQEEYDDNAVCLSSGTLAYVGRNDEVTRSNAKIIVEG